MWLLVGMFGFIILICVVAGWFMKEDMEDSVFTIYYEEEDGKQSTKE